MDPGSGATETPDGGRPGRPCNAPPRHVVDVVEVDPLLGAGVVGAVGEVAAGVGADALGVVGLTGEQV